jgi:dipeptidyl aminopeptidase/acylaminoacyl peptidase
MKIVTTSDGGLWQASISPDGRWIVFRVSSVTDLRQIAVLGSEDGQWTKTQDERSWRYLDSDGAAARDKPRWSVDGRLGVHPVIEAEVAGQNWREGANDGDQNYPAHQDVTRKAWPGNHRAGQWSE